MQFRFERQPHISIYHILAFRHRVTAHLSPSCNLTVFTEALECENCGHTHGEHVFEEQNTRVLICPSQPSCCPDWGLHAHSASQGPERASTEVTGGEETPTPSLGQRGARGQGHRQGFQGLMG